MQRLGLALAVCAACVTGHVNSHRAGWAGCGVGDPAFHKKLSVPAVKVPLNYEGAEMATSRRQLQVSQSQNEGAFVPLSTMHALGQAKPIRIAIIWTVVNNGDTVQGVQRQCTAVGTTIDVQHADGSDGASTVCTATQIVTGVVGAVRGADMMARTAAAVQFWGSTLLVRPVVDPIVIAQSVLANFNLANGTVPNADLVVIMTARPSPNRPVAGYASCQQTDQYNRCTVGWFNWVPELLNVATPTDPTVVGSELHTAVHELTHVLGGMNPGESAANCPFLDASGHNIDPRGTVYIVETDPGYAKPVTKIRSPKVLNLTRSAYGCPTATGLALEDVDLGKGAHWEARVMGPEYMSYGTGSGQVYVSDLTLAYLEDTNQYIANYSNAGPLTPPTADDFVSAGASLGVPDSSTTYSPPAPLSPGHPTWGQGQGCAFLTGNALTSAWPPAYTCTQNQAYGCTPDNMMSAVCVVDAAYTAEATCGSWYVDATSGQLTCGVQNNACVGAACGVPSIFQPYASAAAAAAASAVSSATAASTGGFSNALDYVPVQVGYWGCNVGSAATNATAGTTESGASIGNFASLFGSSANMATFGGQARCPNCRCMLSSLTGLTQSLSLTFTVYGLCYRTNCYRPDYLQVAIKGQFGSNTAYWYKCPAGGGKVYIVGFTGSLHCPDPVPFCAQETITGIKYPEQSFVYEAIFWGVIVGAVLLGMFICTCPCARDRLITFFKRCCGALQFPTTYEEELVPSSRDPSKSVRRLRVAASARNLRLGSPSPRGPDDGEPPTRLPWSWASCLLLCVNTLTMALGLAMLGLVIYGIYAAKIYSTGIPLLGVSALICFVSAVGLCAGRKRAEFGPSCWLLTYFFANLVLLILLVWNIAYQFGFSNWQQLIDSNWDSVSQFLPSQYTTGATYAQQVANATAYVQSNLYWLAGIAVAVCAVYVVAVAAAARLVHFTTLAAMSLTVCAHLLNVFGLILSTVGFYLLVKQGAASNATLIVAVVIAIGLISLVLGALGLVAVFKKKVWVLLCFLAFIVLLIAFLCYCIWLFLSQSSLVTSYVSGLSDAQLASIAGDLGLSVSKAQLVSTLQANLDQLAVTAAMGLFVALVLLVSGWVYWRMVREEQRDNAHKSVPALSDVERMAAADAGARAARRAQQGASQRSMGAAAAPPPLPPQQQQQYAQQAQELQMQQMQRAQQQAFMLQQQQQQAYAQQAQARAQASSAAYGAGAPPPYTAHARNASAPAYSSAVPQYAIAGSTAAPVAGYYRPAAFTPAAPGAGAVPMRASPSPLPPGYEQYNRLPQQHVTGSSRAVASAPPDGVKTVVL